ncbi:unnamed protein product [Strongylus vulgaris]|uniref:Uncharacterized protein n=1 Tax=Strongylus vulgaris TaxID=40348 RepID=A0A3P7L6T3_STRVU|nr:unnamed protein product [Strongylus vulgaris]
MKCCSIYLSNCHSNVCQIVFKWRCFIGRSTILAAAAVHCQAHESIRNRPLESSPLDASFCSTRSELTHGQCRTRKRLRVRRLPRSMSDGEQLIVRSGAFTPLIRCSPPSTPLARSTRLLQKLDRDLLANLESDTAPEQSDTQVYEWDEYNVSFLVG